ncbi:MAG: phosphatase PAP2 family protein [Clostridia bacterium]|nr:phosphatase PAP2 family protein [Clostridia bacterium]
MNEKFAQRLKEIYEDQTLTAALRYACYVCVAVTAYALGYLLVLHAGEDLWFCVRVLGILGIPFLLVSLLRMFINASRPCELLDFYGEIPKRKKGRSFPSRHTFSAFAVGTLVLFYLPGFGLGILAAGIALAVCRVLLGYHFPRDVVAGALIGTVSSLIGYFIIL